MQWQIAAIVWSLVSKRYSLIRVCVTDVFNGIIFACVVVLYLISVLWTGIGMSVEEPEIDGMNPRAHVASELSMT
jgi:hypothetical protein